MTASEAARPPGASNAAFSWTCTLVASAASFGYILALSLAPHVLSRPVAAGSLVSIGLVLGLALTTLLAAAVAQHPKGEAILAPGGLISTPGAALSLANVERVEVATYATGLEYQNLDPHTPLAARFSIPAIVYASLAPGGLCGDALAAIASPGHPERAWLQRVRVVHDPTLDAGYPAGRPARVTLWLGGDVTATAQVADVYGDSVRPLPREAREDKVRAALARALGDAGATRAREAFEAFTAGAPVSTLMRAARPSRAAES
jgi:hypothetical protein